MWLNDTLVAWTVYNYPTPDRYYVHPDHLNTPRVLTDQNQQIRWRWDNDDPFGGNMANSNPGGLGAFTFNLRYPGQYFDRETNDHYNYYRDYSPEIGRYIESDPIGLNGGTNTYTFVKGSPIGRSDPRGLLEADPNNFPAPSSTDPSGPNYDPSNASTTTLAQKWAQLPSEKKCEYKCSVVVGSICKPAYKVPTVYGKVAAYAACEVGVEYACRWVCENPQICEDTANNIRNGAFVLLGQ
jgi:RHS repeat-associated protein